MKALRSPGSTLKPFLYGLQMENGELTTKTRLLDTPYDAEDIFADVQCMMKCLLRKKESVGMRVEYLQI
jgi:membrane peptidoglycan carboxypeptidase